MKTLLKSKIMLAILFTGLLFSCKNNTNTNQEGYNSDVGSTETQVDTTSMYPDTTDVNGTNGVNSAETNGMGTNGSGANGAGTGGTGTNGTGSGIGTGTGTNGTGTNGSGTNGSGTGTGTNNGNSGAGSR